MQYEKKVQLRNGEELLLKNATSEYQKEALENFIRTHEETDYLLSYPDETTMTEEQEGEFLDAKTQSDNEIEILALLDGKVVGTAGIDAVGNKYKISHRAEFGISILKDYWGRGIGTALLNACIECARNAGYLQLELDVVAENTAAIAMYQRAGFEEYGRNPRGMRSRITGFQELISMRLELQ